VLSVVSAADLRRPRLQPLLLLLLILLLTACSQSESNKMDQQIRVALSWTATAVMETEPYRHSSPDKTVKLCEKYLRID
jgi:predicted component of type VI protein secretion system